MSAFSHVLISRPQPEAAELEGLVRELGAEVILQPAFDYHQTDLAQEQAGDLEDLKRLGKSALLVFTSPRAVRFGLSQLDPAVTWSAQVAAVGPATAGALRKAGINTSITPRSGYTSEALLSTLESMGNLPEEAFIIAAPGGRRKLRSGLESMCERVRVLHAYRSKPCEIAPQTLDGLASAKGLLSIWTSANAMKALSQRLPPAQWFQVCQGQWLVISDRLMRLARAYGPGEIHVSAGPRNRDLVAGIRSLM